MVLIASPLWSSGCRRSVPGRALSYNLCTIISVDLYTTGVSIGELSRRTGIGISTLRAWERRYGYPVPERLASGHRRYQEGDVEALRDALRQRRSGATLEAALGQAR